MPFDRVRITSDKTYNSGLFIADFSAVPYGCGTWPAYWTVGPGWPAGGEIDVLFVPFLSYSLIKTLMATTSAAK